MSQKPIAVYTALFGQYDRLKEPRALIKGCDFHCFTDDTSLTSSCWKIHYVDPAGKSSAYLNRKFKMLPHQFLGNYDRSVYIDGNIIIRRDPTPLVAETLREHAIAIPKHTKRDCVYQELSACISRGVLSSELIAHYTDLYKADNFPEHVGLFENNIIVRAHNDSSVIALMEYWWSEYSCHGGRDQLSLVYFTRKLGIDIFPFDGPRVNRRYFMITAHDYFRESGYLSFFKEHIRANEDLNYMFYAFSRLIGLKDKLLKD